MLKIMIVAKKAIASTSNNKNVLTMETTHCNCSEIYLDKPQHKKIIFV